MTVWKLQHTLWFSKHLIYWWAVTQLGHRKLAQSEQRATAFSLALQLVHTICMSSIADMSKRSSMTKSLARSQTPLGGTLVSCLQMGQMMISGWGPSLPWASSWTCFSRHSKQNACRQVSTFGCLNFSEQIEHWCSGLTGVGEAQGLPAPDDPRELPSPSLGTLFPIALSSSILLICLVMVVRTESW